jgi:hypothetical protein
VTAEQHAYHLIHDIPDDSELLDALDSFDLPWSPAEPINLRKRVREQ